jgi:hypothetical protein
MQATGTCVCGTACVRRSRLQVGSHVCRVVVNFDSEPLARKSTSSTKSLVQADKSPPEMFVVLENFEISDASR